jgi:hypothetical protein
MMLRSAPRGRRRSCIVDDSPPERRRPLAARRFKVTSGLASSGQTDNGVSARLFGTLLTCMSDHTTDVFVGVTRRDEPAR